MDFCKQASVKQRSAVLCLRAQHNDNSVQEKDECMQREDVVLGTSTENNLHDTFS